MYHPKFIASNQKEESIVLKGLKNCTLFTAGVDLWSDHSDS